MDALFLFMARMTATADVFLLRNTSAFKKAHLRYSHCNGSQAQGNYFHLVETDLQSLFPTAETL